MSGNAAWRTGGPSFESWSTDQYPFLTGVHCSLILRSPLLSISFRIIIYWLSHHVVLFNTSCWIHL